MIWLPSRVPEVGRALHPKRDATSPYILARERGYDEIADAPRRS